ncbi:MAG: VWA-like domain-containing protein [Bacillota bacterium]|nr:VWA-like domain-containing protein [Bacillota bacterium]
MRIQDAIVNLLLKKPFYGYIASTLTPLESNTVSTISLVDKPALRLVYNKVWFEALSNEYAIGAVLHEILHLVLLHPYRRNGRDKDIWTIACDMAVNELIEEKFLNKEAVTVKKIEKETGLQILCNKSSEYYYSILIQNDEKFSLVGSDDEIKIVLKSGLELKANNTMEGDPSEVNKKAIECMISEVVQQAKSDGEMPDAVGRQVDEIYKKYEINWRNVLKRFLTGKGKVSKRKTYKRESKRFENMPGDKRSVGTKALLAIDESGSISDKDILKFYNEILQIKSITGVSLSVTQFDTKCSEPMPVESFLKNKTRVKNGGTDFRPVFELADKLKTQLVIIFTDGDGTLPESVNQKALWVLTKGGKVDAKFGHQVVFTD